MASLPSSILSKHSPGSNVRPFSVRPACRSNHPAARHTQSLSLAHLAPCALGYCVLCLGTLRGSLPVRHPSSKPEANRGGLPSFPSQLPISPTSPFSKGLRGRFSPHGFERAESRRARGFALVLSFRAQHAQACSSCSRLLLLTFTSTWNAAHCCRAAVAAAGRRPWSSCSPAAVQGRLTLTLFPVF